MEYAPWMFIAYAIYLPVLISLYIAELFVILRNRKTFNSSFYSILNIATVVDILACVISCFIFQLPKYSIVNGFYGHLLGERNWLPPLFAFVDFVIFRYRFVTRGRHKSNIWQRRSLFCAILVCLITSIAPCWFLFNSWIEFMPDETSTIFFIVIYRAHLSDIRRNMGLVTIICSALTSFAYGSCIIKLCLYSTARNFKIERNLFIVGLSSLIFSLPYMTAMVYTYLAIYDLDSPDYYPIVNFLLPWLTDLKYLSLAPILILTNISIRSVIKKLFCRFQSSPGAQRIVVCS